jgi:hypothetical protein
MGEWRYRLVPSFLTSAIDRDEWSASRLSRFTPGRAVITIMISESKSLEAIKCNLFHNYVQTVVVFAYSASSVDSTAVKQLYALWGSPT